MLEAIAISCAIQALCLMALLYVHLARYIGKNGNDEAGFGEYTRPMRKRQKSPVQRAKTWLKTRIGG